MRAPSKLPPIHPEPVWVTRTEVGIVLKLILFERIELGGFPSMFKRIKSGGMARQGMALDSILFKSFESEDSCPCLRGSSRGDGGAWGDGP